MVLSQNSKKELRLIITKKDSVDPVSSVSNDFYYPTKVKLKNGGIQKIALRLNEIEYLVYQEYKSSLRDTVQFNGKILVSSSVGVLYVNSLIKTKKTRGKKRKIKFVFQSKLKNKT